MPDKKSDKKSPLAWFKGIRRHRHNAPNSASPSPVVASVPEGKPGAISEVASPSNMQNDSYDSVKSKNGLQAPDAARRSNPSQPQGHADSTPAQTATSTSPQAQVNPSSAQSSNDTGASAQSKQVQDVNQPAADAIVNSSPDKDGLAKAPKLEWEDLWPKAHDNLKADGSKSTWVKEYEDHLAKEFQSSRQSEGQSSSLPEDFTINSKCVNSIVDHLIQKREEKQWHVKWRTKCFSLDINLRKQVEKFVKVATWSDTLIKQALTTQPHAALAWCAATMVLPLISDFMSKHEDMIEGFNATTEIQVYWRTCEVTCLKHSDSGTFQDLMNQIITLYSYILEYQILVVNHLFKSTRARATDELTWQHDWKGLAKTISDSHSKLSKKPLGLVDKEIIYKSWRNQLSKMDESNKFLKEIQQLTLKSVELLEKSVTIQKTAEENELLKKLSSTPYDKGMIGVGDLVRGTCKWFFESTDFLEWRDMETSGILWVSALPGCGKSVLAKYLIDESLLTTKLLTTNIAHFFFKDGTRTSMTQAMCALLWQLLFYDPTEKLISHAASLRSAMANESLGGDFGSLWKLLEYCASSPACGDIIFVIDALDECDQNDRRSFIKELEDFFCLAKATDSPINLKLFITSRPYDEFNLGRISSKLFKYTTHIPFSKISKEEIELIAKARINELDRLDSDVRAKILGHLINMVAHTYLVLDLTITFIKDKQELFMQPDEIEKQLRNLPTDEFELYKELLDPISQDKTIKLWSFNLLHIVYAAMYPLTPLEANYALKLALKPRTFNSHQSLKSSLFYTGEFPNYIKKWTGFLVDVYDDKLNFIHQTVREFLNPSPQSEGEQCKEHEDQPCYHTSSKSAHLLMFKICWEYLTTEEFDHGKKIVLLDSEGRFSVGTVERLVEAEVDDLLPHYPLIRYAAAEWLNHAMASDPESFLSMEASDLEKAPTLRDAWLLRAAKMGKDQTVAQLCNHGANIDITDSSWSSPLSLAAEAGHNAVVKVLLDTGKLDLNSEDYFGQTPLSVAVENGRQAIVELLLKADKIDVNLKDMYNRTPLWLAVERKNEAIVELLLGMKDVDVVSFRKNSYTALSLAIDKGYEAIMKLLLKTGNVDQLNFKDGFGYTPLFWAFKGQHEALTNLFLGMENVDVNAKGADNKTPLSWAAENGLTVVAKQLLETGKADVNSMDHYGQTPLMWAVAGECEAIVELLLKADEVKVNSKNNNGRTALFLAAERGQAAIVELLLKVDEVDVNSKDINGRTPLLCAVENRQENIVEQLLKTGKVEDVNLKDSGLWDTPLPWAVKRELETVVELLLETGKVSVDSKDRYGRTPLSWAAEEGNGAVMKMLLETRKVDVDLKDDDGRTPLSWAAQKGHNAVITLLLKTGEVDVNSEDNSKTTPLIYAIQNSHGAVVKQLLEMEEVAVDLKDDDGRTPLSLAAEEGNESVMKHLLETGKVDVNSEDNSKNTPLIYAMRNDFEAVVELLLKTGKVDVNSKDNVNQTPLLCAAADGQEAIVKLLLKTDEVDVNLKDNSGQTPLLWAVKTECEAVVELLLQKEAKVDEPDNDGRTPLSWAVENGHRDIVELLLKMGKADVNSNDKSNQTPLSRAKEMENEVIVELLQSFITT